MLFIDNIMILLSIIKH